MDLSTRLQEKGMHPSPSRDGFARRTFTITCTLVAVVLIGGPGCFGSLEGVGDPCVPENEYDPAFSGYDVDSVVFESKSYQCRTRLCLVNHFRGRVTCPYGQDETGESPAGSCATPGDSAKVTGEIGGRRGAKVDAQCLDRSADRAVYCSCRCANTQGKTDDGSAYCACPDGFECKQLEGSIGSANEGLTGGFCIKRGTEYRRGESCGKSCDPSDPQAKCSTR
jgi:hypothetical protein